MTCILWADVVAAEWTKLQLQTSGRTSHAVGSSDVTPALHDFLENLKSKRTRNYVKYVKDSSASDTEDPVRTATRHLSLDNGKSSLEPCNCSRLSPLQNVICMHDLPTLCFQGGPCAPL